MPANPDKNLPLIEILNESRREHVYSGSEDDNAHPPNLVNDPPLRRQTNSTTKHLPSRCPTPEGRVRCHWNKGACVFTFKDVDGLLHHIRTYHVPKDPSPGRGNGKIRCRWEGCRKWRRGQGFRNHIKHHLSRCRSFMKIRTQTPSPRSSCGSISPGPPRRLQDRKSVV